jgi:AAA15 family ATPase/GTPase
MLIKFEVENFRSIKSNIVFHTLVRNYKRFTHHIYKFSENLSILKTSGIYGANGSGKTNLFKALYFIKQLSDNTEYLNTIECNKIFSPFRLNKENENLDSKFIIDFISDNKIYIYEIHINFNLRKVTFEKLIKVNEENEEIIFTRRSQDDKTQLDFPLNDEFHQLKEILSGIIPTYSTFLSFDLFKNDNLTSVRNWFNEKLQFLFPVYEFSDIAYILSKKSEYSDLANEILKYSNTGINNLKIEKVPVDIYLGTENKEQIRHIVQILQDKNYHPFKDSLNNYCTAIKDENNKVFILKLVCMHLDVNNEEVPFDLDQESRGTIVLLHLIPALVLSYGEGVNYFIDDINTSLHPNLLKEIINQYLNHNLGAAKGQLIFNSHEDLIMDENIVRQDEIWLVEKNKYGETDVFPLSDFPNVRFDLNLRKNYLSGKFGAVPFENEPQDLIFSKTIKI